MLLQKICPCARPPVACCFALGEGPLVINCTSDQEAVFPPGVTVVRFVANDVFYSRKDDASVMRELNNLLGFFFLQFLT
jgi:hypothetical protein